MTLEQKVDLLIKEVRTIKKVVMPEQVKTEWVKLSTVLNSIDRSREWVRQQREADSTGTIAIPVGNRYKYNLSKLKQLAA